MELASSLLKYFTTSRQYRVLPSDLNWLASVESLGVNDDLQLLRSSVLLIVTDPSTKSKPFFFEIRCSWSLENVEKSE